MINILTPFSMQTVCSAPCQIDSKALIESNYDGLGQAAFERLMYAAQTALNSLESVSYDLSERKCEMFNSIVSKFYEIADRNPELAHTPKILPKSAVCLIQNGVREKAITASSHFITGLMNGNEWILKIRGEIEELKEMQEKAERDYKVVKPYLSAGQKVVGLGLLSLGLGLLRVEIPKLPQKNVWTYLKVAYGLSNSAVGLYCLISEY
jgi:hypothetical protein